MPHLWGTYQSGGQAGCHLVPGKQAWAPPDPLLPRDAFYTSFSKMSFTGRLGEQAQKRGLPYRGFFLLLTPSPLFFPTTIHKVLPPEEGAPKPNGRASPAHWLPGRH